MHSASRGSFTCSGFIASGFSRLRLSFAAALLASGAMLQAQTGTGLVRHAPSINGNVQGSLQQMLGESVNFNSGANVTGSLYVIGSPTVQLNGSPTYGGTLAGSGATTPSNFSITLNSGAALNHVVRRTNALSWPTVATVPSPSATGSVTVTSSSQTVNWSTTRNLTLNSGVGQFTVPAGTYGDFIANNNSGFTLGVAGATTPSVYNFQNLTLNSISKLLVVGPVTINVANGFSANSTVGNAANPAWVTLNIRNGGLTLNSGCNVYGYVLAPSGNVIINNGTQLVGGLTSDYLTVNGGGVLKLQVISTSNQAPTVSLTAPAGGSTYTAPATITLSANAADADGTVTKVEFYAGTTKLGEDSSSPYSLNLTGVAAGTYTYFARATDNSGATTDSAAVTVTVTNPNQPPVITLTAPLDGATFTSPATIALAATATDPDGTVARVDFYRNGTLVGSDTSAPYESSMIGVPAGSYVFSATAVDNAGASTNSTTANVTVLNPNQAPTVSITAPADDTHYDDPASLTIAATAADADGTVTKVEFFRNGVKVGEDLTAPYELAVTSLAVNTYDFVARATDNLNSGTDSSAVRIVVAHVNDAPTALAQSRNTNEDTQVVITLAGTDPDGDTLTYTVVTQPVHGVLSGTGASRTYTPAADYYGPDSFTFRVSDPDGLQSSPATVNLTVIPVNDAPTAVNKAVTLVEDTNASVVLTGIDIDSPTLTYFYTEPGHGSLSGTAPNLTYTPAANYYGPDSFTYRVFDGEFYSLVATVSLDVTTQNDAPVAVSATLTVTENGSTPVTLSGTDVDGDPLTYHVVDSTTHGALTGTAPNLTYTPATGFVGTDSLTFRVSDGTTTSVLATVTLNVTALPNHAPTATPQSLTTTEDTPLTITLTGTDPENNTLQFSILTYPTHGTLVPSSPAGTYVYTPETNYHGTDSFTFKASDSLLDSAQATISLNVTPMNDAPTAINQLVEAVEDSPIMFNLLASDIDGDTISYVPVTDPANGTLTPVATGPGQPLRFTYTPALNFNGSDTFTYRVSDSSSLQSEVATVTLQVAPVNDAPVAANQTIQLNEDEQASFVLSGSDVDGDVLHFNVLSEPAHGGRSGTAPNLTYTPAANYHGTDELTYTVSDTLLTTEVIHVTFVVASKNDVPVVTDVAVSTLEDTPLPIVLTGTDVDGDALNFTATDGAHGTVTGTSPNFVYTPNANYHGTDTFTYVAHDNDDSSAPATVTVTVISVNDAPVATPQGVSTNEDAQVEIQLHGSDVDGDPLTYGILDHPSHGALTPGATPGSYWYTPAANYNGEDSFTFKVADEQIDSAPATVSITVVPVNDAPTAADIPLTTNEDVPVDFVLAGHDVDGADTLTFEVLTEPAHGTRSGEFPNQTYTPALNYHGSDSFTYRVKDSALAWSNVATVSFDIISANDAPVGTAQDLTLTEDTTLPVVLSGTDVDGDPLTFAVTTQPQHGHLDGTAPNLTYVPDENFHGTDSLVFQAYDSVLTSAPATVTFTITPVNDKPVANPQTYETLPGATIAIVLTGSDVEGDPLNYTVLTQPTHGTLTGTPPNLTYVSASDFAGEDTFNFRVKDAQLDSDPAQIKITTELGPRSRTYTTTADFADGVLVSVNTDTPDELSNKVVMSSFDAVWVANSSKGTLVKIEPDTGRVIGEYWTKPGADGGYPSRVAVDSKGNAWVGNLAHNSIVKVGLAENGFWVDRNGDGQIGTSSSLGDIKEWGTGGINAAQDESILLYVETGGSGVKHLSLDKDDNVWVGSPDGEWQKFDGRTGTLLRTEPSAGTGGQGGFIAPDGKMYSAGTEFLIWQTNSPIVPLPQGDSVRQGAWASARDSQGNLWVTKDWTSTVIKYAPDGTMLGEFYHGEPWAMGIAIDAYDHVWIAHSHCGHSVGHLLPDGTLLGNIEVANHGPVELSIDRRGRIWVVSSTGVVDRIDPQAGPKVDGIPVGKTDLTTGNLGGALWTYGRFTASAFGLASPDGSWTFVYDGLLNGTTWGAFTWDALLANDAKVLVEAALSADGVNYGAFQPLTFTQSTPAGAGRYLKVRTRMVSASTGESPILRDLTVGTAGYTIPAIPVYWDVQAGADIAGNWPDTIQMKSAFRHSPHAFATEPTYLWEQVGGPANKAHFSNPAALRPTVQFDEKGDYVLRLTATLDGVTKTDEVAVSLTPYNRTPYANAGYTTFRADLPSQIWLWGEVRDDGLPLNATVTSHWSKLFGPGDVDFTDPSAPVTHAHFSAPGVYVLQLTATDGELSSSDVTTVWLGYSCIPQAPDGLMSWWQASGNGDDHIGGNQAFTGGGTTYDEGRLGGGFRFDGLNDRMRIFTAPSIDVGKGDGFSIEFWANPDQLKTATMVEYASGAQHGVSVRQVNDGLEVNFKDVNGTNHPVGAGGVFTAGAWRHITASYDRASGEARIYANGQLRGTSQIGSFTLATAYDLNFGGSLPATVESFDGVLDEVSIYNRALYADEIAAIVNHPAGKRPPVSNVSPIIDVGPSLFASANTPVALNATVTDDGQPVDGALVTRWSQVSGPGVVQFLNAASPQTTATFPEGGVYVLKMLADDGGFCSEGLLEVRVGALYKYDTNLEVSAWWTGNDTDFDAVHRLKMERFNGLGYGTGTAAHGFLFDGVDDYGKVNANPATDIGDSAAGWSVELWANAETGRDGVLLNWGTTGAVEGAYLRQVNNGQNLYVYFVNATTGTAYDIEASGVFATGTWAHIAVTYDRVTGFVRIYKNGELAAEKSWGSIRARTNLPLFFGVYRDGQAHTRLIGTLDEVTLYSRPLQLNEVQAIYQGGVIGKVPLDGNLPPVINAGPDQLNVTAGSTITLAGAVTDDGKPAGNILRISWSQLEGPGTANFADPASAATTATFTAPGTYVLQLSANDGLNQATPDTMVVRVGITGSVEPDGSLAAWWPANGEVHEVIHGNHDVEFVPRGPAFGPGKTGQGFLFNGVDHTGRVPAHADLDIGNSATGWSVELWANAATGRDGFLLNWGTTSAVEGAYLRQVNNGQNLYVYFVDASTGTAYDIEASGVFATGTWVHVAVTYDRVTGFVRIYKNGELAAEKSWGSIRARTNLPMFFGVSRDGQGHTRVIGTLDEISLYTKPLAMPEVQALYAAGVNGKAPLDDNLPPVLSAGPDASDLNPNAVIPLNGTVTDDGRPVGYSLTIQWSQVEGPGTTNFADATSATTTATFTAPGTYVLKLSARDAQHVATPDTMVVRVGITGSVEPDGSLAAWWPANGEVHEVIHGNHDVEFVPRGPAFGPGKTGQGFLFNGVDHTGRVPAHADLDIGNSATGWSVELWANAATGRDGFLLNWGTTSAVEGAFLRQVNNGQNLYVYFVDASTGTAYDIEASGVFATGTWVHVAVTYDRVTGFVRIYKNGELAAEKSWGSIRARTNLPMFFGVSRDGQGHTRVIGTLDEISLYTKPLAMPEVQALYSAGVNGKAPLDDNLPPVLSAGPDASDLNPNAVIPLNGTVTDDGRPVGYPLTIQWSQVEGPGTANFADATSATTTATFTAPGTYVLKLSARDAQHVATPDTMVVRVGITGSVEPDGSLAAWWPANGEVHEVIHGNHDVEFVPRGPAFGPGKTGQGFLFNGIDHTGRVPAHADLDIGSSAAGWSVELWVNAETGRDGMLLNWGTTGAVEGAYLRQVNNGQNLYVYSVDATTGTAYDIEASGVFATGTWVHVAVTYDRVTGFVRIYKNGVLAAEKSWGSIRARTNQPLFFGVYRDGQAHMRVIGTLDEISLYTKPLLGTEVSALYAAGMAGKIPSAFNVVPTALLDSPVPASEFVINTPITLSAVAVDTDGTVTKVEFFDGTTKLGEATTADAGQPTRYSYALPTGLPIGLHVLSVRVTDNEFATANSSSATIKVVPILPVVALTAPVNDATVYSGSPLALQATATYSVGAIARVEFYDGATKLGEQATPEAASPSTFQFTFTPGLTAGAHVLTARVVAVDGSVARSTPVNVISQIVLPVVSMTAPTNGGAVLTGAPVMLKASATTTVGTITKVEFFDGTYKLGERTAPDVTGGAVFSYLFNAGFIAGTHSLTAKATTSTATTATSAPVAITALTGPPPAPVLKLSTPLAGAEISAPTELTGTAAGVILRSYAVQVRYQTPANNAPWKTMVTGTESVTDGSLGQLDPTLLRNGIYELRLTAIDQLDATYTESAPYLWLSVVGGMKIGTNTSTSTDLLVPAPGRPLTVVRHYDSTDPRMGDFGLGTTLANQAYTLQVSNTTQRSGQSSSPGTALGEDWFAYTKMSTGPVPFPTYVVDPSPPFEATGLPAEPRVVAITLPDNTTFRFSARLESNGQITPITSGRIVFDALPGTVGQLEALNEATLEVDNIFLNESNSEFTNLVYPDTFAPINPGAYRLTALDGTQYIISTTKGVLQVTDRNGNTTTYSPTRIASSSGAAIDLVRDAAGRITEVKDPTGQSLQYAYDPTGRLITVTDREGRITTYGYFEGTSLVTSIQKPGAILPEFDTYDAVARLASRIGGALANGGTITERDVLNKKEKHRDALNRVTTAEYDEFGNIVKQTNALGFTTTYGFSDSRFRDKATLFTDAEGHSTFYHYNAQGLVDVVTDPNGHTTSYSYDAFGRILTETDALGRTVVQTYDAAGNLLTRTDREGHTTSYAYDTDGNVLTERSPLGSEIRYTYNALGQPLTEGEFAPDGTPGRSRSYTYDPNGNLTSETTYQVNTGGTTVPVTTHYEYDLNGQPTKTIYPDGTFTAKSYSIRGLLATETDRAGKVMSYGYDDAGRPTRTTYADGSYEEKTYDAVGRIITERNALGQVATNTYDDADRLVSVALPDIGSQVRTYDKVGRMLTETDEGGRLTATDYDPAGNITKITHPDGTSTDLSYDEVNNLQTASARVFFDAPTSGGFGYNQAPAGADLDASGALGAKSVPNQLASVRTLPNGLQIKPAGFTLRKSGQHSSLRGSKRLVAQATPPSGPATPRQYVYEYDANGRVTKITNPDTSFSTIAYDAFGRPTSTTNEEGQTWSYEYDQVSGNPARRTKVKGPRDYVETYKYDERDNIEKMIDALGFVTEYEYTDTDQPKYVKYTGPGSSEFTSESYNYDANGRLIHLRDREGNETTYDDQRSPNSKAGSRTITRSVGGVDYVTVETYDAAGNLTKVVDPRGAITTNAYDYFNRRVSTDLPDGRTIKTVYGPGNRVDRTEEIAYGTTRTTSHLYDDNNHLAQTTRPDGSIVDYVFHADGRLQRISQPHYSGAPVNFTEITYDDLNRFTQITDAAGRSTYRKHDKLGRLTDESDTAGTITRREYDALNLVTKLTVAVGKPEAVVTEMTYDVLGNLLTQTEAVDTADARTTSYVYKMLHNGTRITTTYADNTTAQTVMDTRGLVTTTTTPRGNETKTEYDALGRPTKVEAPLSQILTYTYPNFGESQVATDTLGRTSTRKFDLSQRLAEEILPDNFGIRSYLYDGFGQLWRSKDTRGSVTTMEYDNMRRPTKVTRPDDTFTSTTYTAWGEPEIIRDARGVATRYYYDSYLNRLTDITVAFGNPKARTTSYGYDSANRINKITAPNGQVIDSLFNRRGQLTSRSTKLETASGAPTYDETFAYYETGELKKHTDARGDTSYTYDPVGRPQSVTDALNQTTTTEYDDDGNPEKITDALNRVTTRTYDALGRVKTVQYPQGATETYDYNAYRLTQRTLAPTSGGGVPVVTEYGYDALDRVTSVNQHNTPANVVEFRAYDGEGNLLAVSDPDGRITAYEYDSLGLVKLINHPDATTATESFTYDEQGNRKTHTFAPLANDHAYTYTPFGEIESDTDGLGHATTYAYDDAGNRSRMTDPMGRVTQYEYDLASRLRKVTQPGSRISTFDYDAVGNRVAVTDAANRTRRFEYDSLGRLKRALTPLYGSSSGLGANQADPHGSTVNIAGQKFAASQLTYDPAGNLETLTDPNNHLTRFKYDAADRLTHTYLPKSPASPHEINTYDFAGRRTSSVDADGATTTYAYDQVGRLTGVVPPASRIGAPVAYTYYASGRRDTMTDGLGTTRYTYDPRGRLQSEQTPYAGNLTYEHDTLGRLKKLQSSNPGGVNTTYAYDGASRLTSVRDEVYGESTVYGYNDADQLTSVVQPNHTTTTQTYDAVGRHDITTTTSVQASTPLLVQQYTYTPTDQVATRSLNMARPGGLPALQHSTAYSYDDSDRLLRELHTGDTATGQIDYVLDPAGNRMARNSVVAGVASQSFTYDANNGLSSVFTYDTRGNPVSGPGGFTDSYDYLNHHADRTGRVDYLYDGDGRRVGHRSFDSVSGRWTTHTRLISSLNPTGYDQDVEELTDGKLSASYTLGRERLAGLRYVDEATTARGLTIALGADGNVYTWGNGQSTPTVVPGLANIIAVGAGASHYLALGADGKVYSWGADNSFGQLGRSGSAGTPTAIPGLEDIAAISTQLNHTLALAADGTVYAWGDNSSGQLGDGTTTNQASPVQVMSGAVAIAAGQAHSYALALGGHVLSWGDNSFGQLGRAGASPTLTPATISDLSNVTELAAGAFHALALKTDGSVVTWGDNSFGQLGQPAVDSQSVIPTPLDGLSGLTSVVAGARHSLALRSDGRLLAWGDNYAGQLGVANPNRIVSPTLVPGITNLAHLAAGARSSYATTTGGATYAMGDNRSGQLGTGNTNPSAEPVLVPAGTNPAFAAIASGGESAVARNTHAAGLRAQYFAPDVHGHTHLLTGIAGLQSQVYAYDGFGDLLEATSAAGGGLLGSGSANIAAVNPYLYRGERLEGDTGRYHLRARDYDANLGRLATLDSVVGDPSEPMTLNRYGYANANPVGVADPSGHFGISVWEVINAMDAVNSQWDQVAAVGRDEEFDPNQALANFTMALSGFSSPALGVTKKERSIWVNASQGGGMIGSLVGESGAVSASEGGMLGFAAGSDVFFHTNSAPRHRLSMVERTVEQGWVSAYNLRHTFNTGQAANSTDPKAAQTRWPVHLYHDAFLQAQLRGQLIDGPVEARFTRTMQRKLYNQARTALTAVAGRNLNAAQGGGLLDWQATAQPGAEATFLQSVHATGLAGPSQTALFFSELSTHEEYWNTIQQNSEKQHDLYHDFRTGSAYFEAGFKAIDEGHGFEAGLNFTAGLGTAVSMPLSFQPFAEAGSLVNKGVQSFATAVAENTAASLRASVTAAAEQRLRILGNIAANRTATRGIAAGLARMESRAAMRISLTEKLAQNRAATQTINNGLRTMETRAARATSVRLTVKEPRIFSDPSLTAAERFHLEKQFAVKKNAISRAASRGELKWSPGTDDFRIADLQRQYRQDVAARFELRYGRKLSLDDLNADHTVDLIIGGSATQRLKLINESLNKSIGASLLRAGQKAGLRPGDVIDEINFIAR